MKSDEVQPGELSTSANAKSLDATTVLAWHGVMSPRFRWIDLLDGAAPHPLNWTLIPADNLVMGHGDHGEYDLICIGCGPAGEKAATQASYFGHRVAIVEQHATPGGAMVNTG